MRGWTQLCFSSNFSSPWATKDRDWSVLTIYEHSGEILTNSNLLFKLRWFKKALFWPSIPYGRLYNSMHTYSNTQMLPQKLKVIEFTSLQTFWVTQHVWWGNANFSYVVYFHAWSSKCSLLPPKVNNKIDLTRVESKKHFFINWA